MAPAQTAAWLIAWVLLGVTVPYLRAGDGSPQIVLLDGTQPNSHFGEMIVNLGDVNGDQIPDFAVSEPRYRFTTESKALGRIHLYLGQRGHRPSTANQILTGRRIAAAGDTDRDGFADLLVVRARNESPGSEEEEVVLLRGKPMGVDPNPVWTLPLTPVLRSFGGVGDLNGDGFADFCLGQTSDPEDKGEVRVFLGNQKLQWAKADWTHQGDSPGEMFGDTIAGAGDVDHDGYDDLLIAAPRYSEPASHRGRVHLFAGSSKGPSASPVWSANFPLQPRPGVDGQTEQHFGRYLAAAGDVNGDGHADVLIPAVFAERDDPDEGLVFCYLGSKSGLGREPAWIGEPNRSHAMFGWSVSRLGDLNGDGCDEVLIGAKLFDNGQREEGVAAIYFGSPKGLARYPSWVFESDRSVDKAGTQVCGLGDIDGDGFKDFAVNSPGYHEPPGAEGQDLGRVRIFFGSAAGFDADSGLRFIKKLDQWADAEWRRLSGTTQISVLGVVVGAIFAAGMWAREFWRRRTIILVEARDAASRREERERLARDLHDEVGSRLSRMSLMAELVRQDPLDPARTTTQVNQLTATARDLRSAMEQMVAGLKAGPDTLEGLVEVISRQADDYLFGTAMQCYQDLPLELPPGGIPARVREELLPCIREALANIIRHSKATEVWVRIRCEHRQFSVQVEDNGVGFSPAKAKGGNGLQHFHERMNNVGGTCEIRSAPGAGTSIAFNLPLPGALPCPST